MLTSDEPGESRCVRSEMSASAPAKRKRVRPIRELRCASRLHKDILTHPNGSLSTRTRLRQSRRCPTKRLASRKIGRPLRAHSSRDITSRERSGKSRRAREATKYDVIVPVTARRNKNGKTEGKGGTGGAGEEKTTRIPRVDAAAVTFVNALCASAPSGR